MGLVGAGAYGSEVKAVRWDSESSGELGVMKSFPRIISVGAKEQGLDRASRLGNASHAVDPSLVDNSRLDFEKKLIFMLSNCV